MAPEILCDHLYNDRVNFDCAVDIYALAITIHQLIHNRLPFLYQSHSLATHSVMLKRYGTLVHNTKNADLNDLLKQMLHYDPKERISASDILSHPFLQNPLEESEDE